MGAHDAAWHRTLVTKPEPFHGNHTQRAVAPELLSSFRASRGAPAGSDGAARPGSPAHAAAHPAQRRGSHARAVLDRDDPRGRRPPVADPRQLPGTLRGHHRNADEPPQHARADPGVRAARLSALLRPSQAPRYAPHRARDAAPHARGGEGTSALGQALARRAGSHPARARRRRDARVRGGRRKNLRAAHGRIRLAEGGMSASALAPLAAPGADPAVERGPRAVIRPLRRATMPDSRTDRLYFAQVRDDPMLELEALRPAMRGTIVIIGSGGCTALSLVAAGASDVIAVDANQAQNHLIELKAAAVAALGVAGALAFLGGTPCPASARRAAYKRLRFALGGPARAYWDARGAQVGRGVLGAGVTERFIAVLALAVRFGIHSRRRIERLFACRTLEEQRAFYDREWNTRRWRMLFHVVLNRWVFDRTYDPAFFANVENPSFSEHFRLLAEHAIADVPVAGNYFLRHMLTGRYPTHVEGGAPTYLTAAGSRVLREERH